MERIDGREIAREVYAELGQRIAQLKEQGIVPTLVILQVGNDETTNTYIRAKQRAAEPIGITVRVERFNSSMEPALLQETLAKTIRDLNNDSSVNGIILQLPVPATIDDQAIIDEIRAEKDVDGLTATNQAALEAGRELMVPATPQGILRILTAYHVPIEGASVGLIGHGRLVGRPLAHMLRFRSANVRIGDSKTDDLSTVTRGADIVIAAAGAAGIVTPDMVEPNSVLIDVGLSEVDAKLASDITDQAKEKARLATPVPGGVGPMTVASLLANVVLAAELACLRDSQ